MPFLFRCLILFFSVFLCFSRSDAASFSWHGYVPADLDTAFLIREYHRISRTVGLGSENDSGVVTVLFYRSYEGRKKGLRLPEWGGGGALGKDSIVLPIDRQSAFYASDIHRILLHEMVHITLARAYGHLRIPRWFHEGVAMTLSGDISFDQQVQLTRAIILKKLVPLDSMESMNRFSRWRAGVAYSQCQFAVTFLVSVYGLDMLPELLSEARKTRGFDSACVRVFGLTTKEFEHLVEERMKARYRMFFIVGDYAFIWGGIFILSIIAFVTTRYRRHIRLRDMAREEADGDSDDTDGEDGK